MKSIEELWSSDTYWHLISSVISGLDHGESQGRVGGYSIFHIEITPCPSSANKLGNNNPSWNDTNVIKWYQMCKKIKSKDSVEGRLSPIRVLSPSDLAWAAKGFTGLLALLIMDYPWSWLEMLHRLQLQRAQNRSWQRCIYSGRLFASKCSSACICSTMCAFVTPVDQRDVWLSHIQ